MGTQGRSRSRHPHVGGQAWVRTQREMITSTYVGKDTGVLRSHVESEPLERAVRELLVGVKPALQRRPRQEHPAFGPRGVPAPLMVLREATDFVWAVRFAVMHSASSPYRQQALRLYVDLRLELAMQGVGPVGLLAWIMRRLTTAWPQSVHKYVSAVKSLTERIDVVVNGLVSHWWVSDFLNACKKSWGPPAPVRGATRLPAGVYQKVISDRQVSLDVRQVIALAWVRGGRAADVLAMREQGLWTPGPKDLPADVVAVMATAVAGSAAVAMEFQGVKGYPLGVVDALYVVLPPQELQLVREMLQRTRPTSPPHSRALLFPNVTTAKVAEALARWGPYSAHSLRKTRIQQWIENGFSIHQVAILSMHRSMESVMAYAARPDDETIKSMLRLSMVGQESVGAVSEEMNLESDGAFAGGC